MRVIVSGGGTGGHIYPALTIADKIKELCPETEIIFVGTREGLEQEIVPRAGYRLEYIEVAGFRRKLSRGTVTSTLKLLHGLRDAQRLLHKFKPDVVVGTGGYVCGPVLFRAALQGIPTAIQEQNALPGITNKILAHFVKEVYLGYREAEKYLGGSSAKIFTGNPVREELLTAERSEAFQLWHLDPQKKTLLVAGGSRGARSINRAMVTVLGALAGKPGVQVLHITGETDYVKVMAALPEKIRSADNIHLFSYLHQMLAAIAAADLAVFRAGAIGLAELTAKGVPAILVPYPYATGKHQDYNAAALVSNNAARVISDAELTGELLLDTVEELLNNELELQLMQKNALLLGKPQAAADIARHILSLAGKKQEEIK